jgi:pyruvate/2-oxoglutarate dehydrogenase complex dihydrolipoamide acyltransferase (E2) component
MTATLSADHRAVDGVDAARFLETFKQAMEDPITLLPDPKEAMS